MLLAADLELQVIQLVFVFQRSLFTQHNVEETPSAAGDCLTVSLHLHMNQSERLNYISSTLFPEPVELYYPAPAAVAFSHIYCVSKKHIQSTPTPSKYDILLL